MKTRGSGWNDDDKRKLKDLRKQGMPWDKVFAQFPDRTPKSIHACFHRVNNDTGLQIYRRRWSFSEIAQLKRLVEVEHVPFLKIDTILKRSRGASFMKYQALQNPPTASKPPATIQPPWTDADMIRATELWQQLFLDVHDADAPREAKHAVIEAIATELGRTTVAVQRRMEIHGAHFGLSLWRYSETAKKALAEREARQQGYYRRSLTATLLGDPPVGYSALDERQQA